MNNDGSARTGRPRFPLGRVVGTPGALAALSEAGQSPGELLDRHARADWGEVGPEDWRANDGALPSPTGSCPRTA